MDTYSGYNQINMDPMIVSNMNLIPNHGNYYWDVIPLRFNNADGIIQVQQM